MSPIPPTSKVSLRTFRDRLPCPDTNSLFRDRKSVTLDAWRCQLSDAMKNEPPMRRDPKKTVSIEVRVSSEEKHAFAEACRSANRSVSEVLRRSMSVFVLLHGVQQRITRSMTFLFQRPIRAALTALGSACTLTAGVLLVPSASADMPLAYQVNLDDGIGQIVSQGVTGRGSEGSGPVSDSLGESVRYALVVEPCGAAAAPSCPDGAAHVMLSVWELRDGEDWRAEDRGIVTSQSGEIRFEEVLSDGRVLTLIVGPQSES